MVLVADHGEVHILYSVLLRHCDDIVIPLSEFTSCLPSDVASAVLSPMLQATSRSGRVTPLLMLPTNGCVEV